MITSRYLQANDYELLSSSLANDEYHSDISPVFFVEPDTITLVYEDNKGPVMFVRGKGVIEDNKKNLWLTVQYVSNADGKRNLRTMLIGFPALAEKAKTNGFAEIKFNSYAPLLRKFCITRLGFIEAADDTLRYLIP